MHNETTRWVCAAHPKAKLRFISLNTHNLGNYWLEGNDALGFDIYVADIYEDYYLGYAESLAEALELIRELQEDN